MTMTRIRARAWYTILPLLLSLHSLPVLAADAASKPRQPLAPAQTPLKQQVPANTSKVQQPEPTRGGTPAEPLEEAERRVPDTLRHRERAVTSDDYRQLAPKTPGARIQRVPVQPQPRAGPAAGKMIIDDNKPARSHGFANPAMKYKGVPPDDGKPATQGQGFAPPGAAVGMEKADEEEKPADQTQQQ